MKTLRFFFLLLLLANVTVFAWQSGYLGTIDDGREPGRLDEQRSADKLKVLSAKDAETAAPPAPAAAEPSPTADGGGTAKPAALCQQLSGIKLAEARQWAAVAATKSADAKFSITPTDNPSRYEVLIAALAGREGVDAKLKELKVLGVAAQPHAVADGGEKLALVFAAFPNEAEAKTYLQGLTDRGVKTARIVPRYPATTTAQVEVRGLDPARIKEQWSNRSDIRIAECPAR